MLLVALAFRHYIPSTMHVNAGPAFWLSVVLAHVMSFVITYSLGLLSLWIYEVRSLYNFYYLPSLIFSGQIAPIALFPSSWQAIVRVLPFQYTLAFPAGVFLERITGTQLMFGFGMQIAWILVGMAASALLWRGGLKRYTAFGI
jgi:ABC-2 type transport system permease protein